MKAILRKPRLSKGQSLVEFGVVIIIMFIIISGVVEFGMLLFQYIAMRDAAQEGAVYISLYPDACDQTIQRVKTDLYNTDPSQVEVTVNVNGVECHAAAAADRCALNGAQVTVHQPNYKITMPFLGTFLGRQTLDISAQMTSTIIRPPCP